jgi:hypothetical protein
MTIETKFSIAKDFSRHPGPRFRNQGPKSGETLRALLKRLLERNPGTVIVVDLDGTSGMGSSFLDEAFGGLIRSDGFSREFVKSHFRFQSRLDPSYVLEIRESIDDARPE